MSIEKDTKLRNKFYNAKIYKIIDNTNNNVYIGSCCSSLKTRLSKHKCSYEMFLFNNIKSFEIIKNKDYIKSFDIIFNNDYKIELLEDCNVKTKEELFERERFFIKNNECLNKNIPDISYKQYYNDNINKIDDYQKEYYETNKNKAKDKAKEYYETNKDKFKERFECECGSQYMRYNKSKHLKTDKHQNYLKTLK